MPTPGTHDTTPDPARPETDGAAAGAARRSAPDAAAQGGARGKANRARATRRQFLLGGAVAGVGAVAAIGLDAMLRRPTDPAAAGGEGGDDGKDGKDGASGAVRLHGGDTVPFYGAHQAGIATAPQAHATLVALDLREGVDRGALTRMMRLLSDDAARLTQGVPALADSEPELALAPARLTVTFGFGPGFVARAGGAAPAWLAPLPPFTIDRLQPEFSGGDLLIQVAADDPLTVSHTARMLLKDTRTFASVRWVQRGFRRAVGSEKAGTTMRNLFGQVDGTVNVRPGTPEFDKVVWTAPTGTAGAWMAGGTSAVVRRIHMNLDTWDHLDRPGREQSVGRTLANGAPLTGVHEHDEPDFEAKTAIGFPVIPEFSHMRRARSDNPDEQIFRRSYNYDDAPTGAEIAEAGLVFVSFQADVDRQFTPMQRRLDELDLLNTWTTPVGSAVFAIPPGCAEGGFVGDTLLA
ncbi:MAG: Dyp-type peroxidase [Microbacteriaceae bacterium]